MFFFFAFLSLSLSVSLSRRSRLNIVFIPFGLSCWLTWVVSFEDGGWLGRDGRVSSILLRMLPRLGTPAFKVWGKTEGERERERERQGEIERKRERDTHKKADLNPGLFLRPRDSSGC